MNNTHRKALTRGFTLVELLTVVTIVGLLAIFAIPSYMNYVVRAKREGAEQVLVTVASKQEQFFMDNKTYADALDDLGYSAATFGTDSNGEIVGASDSDARYAYSVEAVNTTGTGVITAYRATATAKGAQATDDADCAILMIDNSGKKTSTTSLNAATSDCW